MNREVLLRGITWLRFPLIIAVVCIHSDIREASQQLSLLPFFSRFMELFRNGFCFPALYMFFFISGFLFFRERSFDAALFLSKLKRRARTLLMPYLLWNGLTLAVICLFLYFRPDFSFFLKRPVSTFRWYDFLLVFWDKQLVTGLADDPHGPLLLQFWFIQCLMIVILCTPLIWLGLRKMGFFFVVLLGLLHVFLPSPECAGFRTEAFFYFAVGAYLSQYQSFGSLSARVLPWCVCSLLLGIVGLFFSKVSLLYHLSFFMLLLSVGCRMSASLSASGEKAVKWLSGSSFFVFAFHIFIAGAVMNLVGRLPVEWNEWMAFAAFFLGVMVNILLCLAFYSILKQLFPRLVKVLTGNR